MSDWNKESRRVSEFVDKFLDRALGASNDIRQRVPVYDALPNQFYIGKLLPQGASLGQSEYKIKIAPCAYITTFLIKGQPNKIKLRITQSFNLYFRTAIHRSNNGSEREADPSWLERYGELADPKLPAKSGRDDMWVVWQERSRAIPYEYTQAVDSLKAPAGSKNRRLRGKYDSASAVEAYIRKRYCSTAVIELTGPTDEANATLDLTTFREYYGSLGSAPEWEGKIEVIVSPTEDGNTRLKLYLINTLSKAPRYIRDGDPNWYDTHLKIELLDEYEIVPIRCPVLDKASDKVPMVTAEAKNCAFDEINSAPEKRILVFSPVARTRTLRRIARNISFSFRQSAEEPIQLLELFYTFLKKEGASRETLAAYRQDIDLILRDDKAVKAVGMVANVYARSIAEDGTWRLHQLATLIRAAAIYLKREDDSNTPPKPIVLNVPTAGGKTEAFFAAGMFCTFYELQHKRRSVNIIKYPMTLLSNDQIIRLARYSMIVDEMAQRALGIAYMVGQKGKHKPDEIIEHCPYPNPVAEDGMCGEAWTSYKVSRGVPKLKCSKGHVLHLGVDNNENMLTRQCPTFIVSTWDKFVSQAAQRRLGLLFGAKRYYCPKHGFIDYAEASQSYYQNRPPSKEMVCRIYEEGVMCGRNDVREATSVVPGIIVFDEGHLIRESAGTLDSHFETAYFQIAQDLSRKQPISIVSTATIAGIEDFLIQLGLIDQERIDSTAFYIMPEPQEERVFFKDLERDMQHESIAVVPFDVMLTWAIPNLIDVFFETLASDYGYDATNQTATPPEGCEHLRQVMVYCSSYKNINALAEMNRNAVAANRISRGREKLQTRQLSARYFDKVKAQTAIDNVKNARQQIVYATNIASIGIDIENLDVIFFFGLPTNVSEFIQSMNRTGRRQGRPAICVAILGPNKERDMSYYRYWSQFINGTDTIIEPVPLNRYASSAVERTFNNVATALLLMDYAHRTQRSLFKAGDIETALDGVLPSDEILDKLRSIYRVEDDPAQEYGQLIDKLWAKFTSLIKQAPSDKFVSQVFGREWMISLRNKGRRVPINTPAVTELVETVGAGSFFTGDMDSDEISEAERIEQKQ